VKLLDYEVEIGLVIGREPPWAPRSRRLNMADFVVGLVLTNDIRRDAAAQSSSSNRMYPTFTPVGPALVLVDAGTQALRGVALQLSVNGEVRQNMVVEATSLQPVEAPQALTKFRSSTRVTSCQAPGGHCTDPHGVAPGVTSTWVHLAAQPKRTLAPADGDVIGQCGHRRRRHQPRRPAQCGKRARRRTVCRSSCCGDHRCRPGRIAAATLLGQYGVECLVLDRHETVYPLPRRCTPTTRWSASCPAGHRRRVRRPTGGRMVFG
jgi:hypothetical protein